MTQFYIDPGPDGDNYPTHNGTSKSTPWKEWQDVLDYQSGVGFAAGDTISIIENGECHWTITIPTSGSLAAGDITINAYNAGDTEILPENRPKIHGADKAGAFNCDQTTGNKLLNPSFEGTWTGSPLSPPNWTVTTSGGSTLTEETTEVYSGSSACHISRNTVQTEYAAINQVGMVLSTNTKYRVGIHHWETSPDGDLRCAVQVIAKFAGVPYYLVPGDTREEDTWSPTMSWIVLPLKNSYAEGPDYIDFDLGSTIGTTYEINITTNEMPPGPVPDGDVYFDSVTFGVRGADTFNHVEIPNLDDFIGGGLNDNFWTTYAAGSAAVSMIEDDRFGKYPALVMDSSDSDVYVESIDIALEESTVYKLGVRHHEEQFYTQTTGDCSVRLIRQSDPLEYWNGSSWTTTPSDAISERSLDWKKTFEEFTTPAGGVQNYRVRLGRKASTMGDKMRVFYTECSIVEKDIDDEVYWTYFNATPTFVFYTGYVEGVYREHYQLYEDNATAGHPNLGCWQYNAGTDVLYINVGNDPEDAIVECSVREKCVDYNDKSYVTVQDIECLKAYGDAVDFGSHASSRATNLTFKDSKTQDSGKLGVCIGYHPPDPTYLGTPPVDDELTPANIRVENVHVHRFNRIDKKQIEVSGGYYYQFPNGGIRLFGGDDALAEDGDLVGTVDIINCKIEGDGPLVNYGGWRNGINVHLGKEVTIRGCEVCKVPDHGIIVAGQEIDYTSGPWAVTDLGDVRHFIIEHCYCHDNGDDHISPMGVQYIGNKVRYNLMHTTADNNIDSHHCYMLEIYGNVMYGGVNEQVAIRNTTGYPLKGSAFIFNNIFANWGQEWGGVESRANMRYGCAVCLIVPEADTNLNVVDNNIFWSEHSASTAAYPFVWLNSTPARVQKTLAQAQAQGFAAHSQEINPRWTDHLNNDFSLLPISPCIGAGLDLSKLRTYLSKVGVASGYDLWFDNENASEEIMDHNTYWPGGVEKINQSGLNANGLWDIGCFAFTTERHSVLFTDSGVPADDLTPTVVRYISTNGTHITPVPTIYNLGGGAYGFSTKVNAKTLVVIDGGSSLSGSERYKMLEAGVNADYQDRVRRINSLNEDMHSDLSDGGRLDLIFDSILADSNELQGDLADGGRLDLLIDAIKAATDKIPETFKKNTAFDNFTFLMVNASDGFSPQGGLTVTGGSLKDSATSFEATASVTEVSQANALGLYRVNLSASNLNCDFGVLRFTATGGRTLHIPFKTVP